MFKLIIFIILFFIIKIKCANNNLCNRKTENQMDLALARLLVFGQKSMKFPENAQQLQPYCNEAKGIFQRITLYTKNCLNKFGRDSATVILHSVNQEILSVCKSGRLNRRAQSLLEAASCGNQGNSKFNKNCYVKLIDGFMGAMNGDVKKRIPISCCNYYEFLRCFEREAEDVPNCKPKVIDFFIKWLTKIFEGITVLMCNVYDDSNSQCDTVIKEAPLRNSTQKRFKSVLLPLINLAMSLGDEDIPTE